MLCLKRREGTRIHIGDNVVVIVHKIEGRSVSIGIEAPADVTIRRGELRVYRPGEKKKAS